ncbi:MAG: alpha/beta fold hydrolase [bacterium]
MFKGFETFDIDCNGVNIHGVSGGNGAPILLLHGYPQTHVMWHKLAPGLSKTHTVVAADLRGYGQSAKPASTSDHSSYSKRAMAADMVELMAQLGHRRFIICGHDRGARVAHRLALDWSQRVEKMVLLDIAPTREMYRNTDELFAKSYWWWFYLVQKAPLPENMIGADPRGYWLAKCGNSSSGLTPFSDEALAQYLQYFDDPDTIRASCEDYRAAASIDIEHDDSDGDRKIVCPILVIWGKDGVIECCFDALALWRQRASDVTGFAMQGGHYLAEENPDLLYGHLQEFLNLDPREHESKKI